MAAMVKRINVRRLWGILSFIVRLNAGQTLAYSFD